jgi:glycerol-3-phosphate dehydrogenase
MKRTETLSTIRERTSPWDLVIIGGGATGVGCALDAASRGYEVLLLEQHDFGKGTSSRSTKLIHGGVRYLRQGDVSLVREALHERALLLRNAPHTVKIQAFIVPCYGRLQQIYYGAGLKAYDLLSKGGEVGNSRILARRETLREFPTLNSSGLSGAIKYYDGRFDDTRLLMDLVAAAQTNGAVMSNYSPVRSLMKNSAGKITGLTFLDVETDDVFSVAARSVINATGVFCDPIRKMSDVAASRIITYAQGIHLVLDRRFLPSETALMIPKTSDGRVLFCIPWHHHTLIGTTDTPVSRADLEPKALEGEVDFVLNTAAQYLSERPTRDDILSVFAGIRPLVHDGVNSKTSKLSRSHDLFVDNAGLVTITGGKWTTYRRMAEDAVDRALYVGGIDFRPSVTAELPIPDSIDPGSGDADRLVEGLPYTTNEIVHAVRHKMARTVEDVLARRTRLLFLNAKVAIETAPLAARIIAEELGKNEDWITSQVEEFTMLARGYLAN